MSPSDTLVSCHELQAPWCQSRLSVPELCKFSIEPGQILPHYCVVRRQLPQAHDDGVAVLKRADGLAARALARQRLAHAPVCPGELALPSSISRIGLGKVLPDGERGLVGGERHREVA